MWILELGRIAFIRSLEQKNTVGRLSGRRKFYPVSIAAAERIVDENPRLKGLVELRLQNNDENIFTGIIKDDEFINLTICNPPFHAALADATAVVIRKISNLKRRKSPIRNSILAGQIANFGLKAAKQNSLGI